MSLQVWLPLNGDLHNQGLQNITVTNHSATIDNDGKIGKCYSFNNSTYLSTSNISIDKNSWSMAAWIYIRSTPNSSTNAYMVGIGASSGAYFTGCLDLYGTNFVVRIGNSNYNSDIACSLNTWTHFAATSTNNTLKMYINGVLVKTVSITPYANYQTLYIGARAGGVGPFNGKINDVRIYNNVLSDKEIEELAKGLVLWYQLDGRNDTQLPLGYQQLEYLEGTGTQYIETNRVPLDTDEFKFKYSLQTIDAYKGPFGAYSAEAANTVRIIPQNGSATKLLLYFNSKASGGHVYAPDNFTTTVGQIVEGSLSKTAYYLKNLTIGTTAQASSATDLFTTKGTALVGTMKLFGQASNYLSNSRIYYFGVYNNGVCKQYFIPAKKLSDNTLGMYDIISKTFFTNAGTGTFIAGPVINTPTIIYDSSGYNNNGTIVGNLQMVKGSPKYNYSTQFSGNTNYIEAASLPATTSTICAWVKFNTIPNSGYFMILHDKVSQLAIGHSFTSNHLITYIGSESIGSWITFQPTENTWYHIAVVKTGATTRNIYINGAQITATDTSYWSGDLDTFMIGGRHTNGQYQDFFNGKISDVRAYAVALTATQIQELYNTSMNVDSNGNSIPRGV